MRKIPSFLSLPELRFEKFMRFDELGITFHKKPYNIAPGWIAVHGDHTPIKSQGGLSALEAARRHGKSVISGHTHRAGRSSFTEASGGRIGRILHGVEVGNLMDFQRLHTPRDRLIGNRPSRLCTSMVRMCRSILSTSRRMAPS
jgi:hypothetical protein